MAISFNSINEGVGETCTRWVLINIIYFFKFPLIMWNQILRNKCEIIHPLPPAGPPQGSKIVIFSFNSISILIKFPPTYPWQMVPYGFKYTQWEWLLSGLGSRGVVGAGNCKCRLGAGDVGWMLYTQMLNKNNFPVRCVHLHYTQGGSHVNCVYSCSSPPKLLSSGSKELRFYCPSGGVYLGV